MKKNIAIILFAFMPIINWAVTNFPLENGSISTNSTINLTTFYSNNSEAIIRVANDVTLTLYNNRGGICFKIGSNTNIILDKATLDNSSTGACAFYIEGTNNTITIKNEDNNMLGGTSYPAIYVKLGAEVTLNGSGKLWIYGGSGAAAIGSNNVYESGSIIIDGSPEIHAYGGSGGAAIGGGSGQDASNITINGGTITATAGPGGGAAGIGGGGKGDAGTIKITGGTITAEGNAGGAGIGGGERGNLTEINISGGVIQATGGSSGGCGIGKGKSSGYYCDGSINIGGGRVIATGKLGGAGIGGGLYSFTPNLTIRGGEVYAEGSTFNSYTLGDDLGDGGDVSGGSYYLKISGNTTAVFARNDRWHSNKTITGLTKVSEKFDGICKNTAYGYNFPAWNMSPTTIAKAYGYIKQYTAYFKSNGGNTYSKTDKVSPVEDITPPSTNPTRTGYSFTNWYSESACTNLFVFTNHTISATTYIYAGWSANEYEVTFDSNEGTSGSMANQTIVFGESETLLKNEYARTGYTFNGWNTKADGSGTTYADQSNFKMTTEGATLYAVWKPITYTVSFDGNTNTGGSTENQVFTYDTPQNLTLNGFTKTGYSFTEWNTSSDGNGTPYSDGDSVNNLSTTNTGIIELFAEWEINTYLISYELDNGTNDAANPGTYTVESEDIILADATKNGYSFIGWYADAGFNQQVTSIPQGSTGDTTLYANFSPITYSIKYELDGGTNDIVNPSTYNIESENIVLADATKKGYTFVGWYADAGFNQQVTSIPNGSTGDTTLYANFNIITYTISYELDGGTNDVVNPGTYTVEYENIVLADATKKGYTFEGWYADAGFNQQVTSIPQGSMGDTTLYANFSTISYSITYELDGGLNDAANPGTYYIESENIILANATKKGYSFVGWYADAGFNQQVTSIPKGSTGDTTLYANFSSITYSITYNLDNGTNDLTNPDTYTVESEDILLADATKKGYTFAGWYADADFNQKVISIPKGSTGDTTLYANFSSITYAINYELDGGTNDAANPCNYTIESENIILADATKKGYTFVGWYTDAGFNQQVTSIPKGSVGDTTLYANFSIITFTISYELDGGTNDVVNPGTYTVESEKIVLSDATKTGYTFEGWYADAGFNQQVTSIPKGSNGDTTLYANFSSITYSITYNLDNGTNDLTNPDIYTVESEDIILANATKKGYTFLGWYSDPEHTTQISIIAKGSTEDVILYAKFNPTRYHITYMLDNGINHITNPVAYNINSPDVVFSDATKEGCIFMGWYRDAAFSSRITRIPTGSTGSINVYAKFNPITYSISYKLDNGINDAGNPSKYNVEFDDIVLADATKKGYTFNGWYSDPDFSVQVSEIVQGSTGDTTLYAKFTLSNYAITYNLDSGANDAANPTTYNIFSEDIILADATKEGYTFAGWFSDAGFVSQISEIKQGSTDDIELYAKFNINSFTVNFLDWNGELLFEQSVNYGDSTNVPSNLARLNYLFDGWETANGIRVIDFSNITANLTVTACYVLVTDINDITKSDVCVYPNPVSDGELHIKASNELNGVTIIDMNGRVVHVSSDTSATQTIDVSNWNSGTYFIKVANGIHKIIVL